MSEGVVMSPTWSRYDLTWLFRRKCESMRDFSHWDPVKTYSTAARRRFSSFTAYHTMRKYEERYFIKLTTCLLLKLVDIFRASGHAGGPFLKLSSSRTSFLSIRRLSCNTTRYVLRRIFQFQLSRAVYLYQLPFKVASFLDISKLWLCGWWEGISLNGTPTSASHLCSLFCVPTYLLLYVLSYSCTVILP